MEVKTFKDIIIDSLIANKFKKRGNYYCLYPNDILIVVGLQKSNYSNAFYVEIGYVISALHPSLDKPKAVDGDVRVRFSFDKKGKETDVFELDEYSESEINELMRQVNENIEKYINPVTSINKLKDLLHENPTMLFKTSLKAKKIMGLM